MVSLMDKITVKNLDLYYGDFKALKTVNMNIAPNEVTAFIGPSGCGKSTLLKSLNRMNDLVEGCKITGEILLDGEDIYGNIDVNQLRKRVGMVFQKPNPFPMSVYDNIAYGPRTHGIRSKVKLDEIVEKSLRGAAIWDELKDRLKKSALGLSGGQQQRLCIARALAVKPDVLLMDIRMAGMTGLEAAEHLLAEFPDARILFLTTFEDDEYIVKALSIGAKGYIIKQDFESIAPAVKAVFAGQSVFGEAVAGKLPGIIRQEQPFDYKSHGISERERRVIELVARGYSNREIADTLCLSEGTVRNYISTVLDKLELRDRTNLAVFYYQHMRKKED